MMAFKLLLNSQFVIFINILNLWLVIPEYISENEGKQDVLFFYLFSGPDEASKDV